MPRYIIHVGPHKTATTYLQVLFRSLSPQLLDRGVLYPHEWLHGFTEGHYHLAARLGADSHASLRHDFDRLNNSGCQTILISAEDLCSLSTDQLMVLKSFLHGEWSIVFYLRRWSELMPSSWQEIVKQGYSTTFPEMMANSLMDPYTSATINYAFQLDRFGQVFGIDSLSLVSYSNIIDQGHDVGEHFFKAFLGWPDAPLTSGIRPNASLNIFDVELIRVLNAIEWEKLQHRSDRLRLKYLETQEELGLDNVFRAMEGHRMTARFNEDAPNLRRLHEEIYATYGRRLIPPEAGRYLFVPRTSIVEYIGQDYLAEEGILDQLTAVWKKIRRRLASSRSRES